MADLVLLPEQIVEGRRLGRHIYLDERDLAFSAERATTARSVMHSTHGQVLNQGSIGSCTGNALVDCLMYDPLWNGWNFTEDDALSVYEQATREDQIQGSYPPDDTGSYGNAVAQVAVERGWITRYDHCADLAHLQETLTLQPVIAGFSWYQGFDNPTGDGECQLVGSVRGGHEVCFMGLDMEQQRVWFMNSWSPQWGAGGFAWFSFSTLQQLFSQSLDITVPVISAPPPPPPPPPPPTPTAITVAVTPTSVTQGGSITVSGSGWKPSTSVNFGIDTLPNGLIGGVSSDASGHVAPATFAIPASVTVGQHAIVANGLDSTGTFNGVGVALTVTGAPAPPTPSAGFFASPRVAEKIFHKRAHPRARPDADYTWFQTRDAAAAYGRPCRQCRP